MQLCPQWSREMRWERGGPLIHVERRGPRVGEMLTESQRTPGNRQIWYCPRMWVSI